jgi:hypothetical protein
MKRIAHDGLHNSLCSPNIGSAIKSRLTRCAGNVTFMGTSQKILAGVSECKRTLEIPSCRWEDVIAVTKAGRYGVCAGFIWFRVVSNVGIL